LEKYYNTGFRCHPEWAGHGGISGYEESLCPFDA